MGANVTLNKHLWPMHSPNLNIDNHCTCKLIFIVISSMPIIFLLWTDYKPGGGIPIGCIGIPCIDIGNGIGGIPCGGGIPIIWGIIGGITIVFGKAGWFFGFFVSTSSSSLPLSECQKQCFYCWCNIKIRKIIGVCVSDHKLLKKKTATSYFLLIVRALTDIKKNSGVLGTLKFCTPVVYV